MVEHHVTNVPSCCAVQTVNRKYVQCAGGEEELYALDPDPYEVVNRASDPGFALAIAMLRTRAHTLCTPPPPGFVFSH